MTISATTQGIKPGVCLSTNRPVNPFDGMVIYETDTDKTLVWNSTGWVFLATSRANPVGLEAIIPTSTAVGGGTATIGANGEVAFTSVTTSFSLNGVFSSAYTNYKILYRATYASDGNLDTKLRASGTDISTNYSWSIFYSNTTSMNIQNTTSTYSIHGITGCTSRFTTFDVLSPFLTANTGIIGTTSERNAAGTYGMMNFGNTQNSSTSFDGITFISTTAQTGTVSVYGYAK